MKRFLYEVFVHLAIFFDYKSYQFAFVTLSQSGAKDPNPSGPYSVRISVSDNNATIYSTKSNILIVF